MQSIYGFSWKFGREKFVQSYWTKSNWNQIATIPLKGAYAAFPGGLVAKTPCSQSWEQGFDPWSGNWILHPYLRPSAAK